MAIVIPSKNIYGNIENQKVRANAVKGIEVSANNPKIVVFDDENVFSEKRSGAVGDNENHKTEKSSGMAIIEDVTSFYGTVAFSQYKNQSSVLIDGLAVKRKTGNSFVDSLNIGVNDNGESRISFSVYGTISRGSCSSYVNAYFSSGSVVINETQLMENIVMDSPRKEKSSYKLPQKVETKYEDVAHNVTSVVELPKDNLESVYISSSSNEYFVLSNIKIPCGATTISLCAHEYYESSSSSSNGQKIWNFEGNYEIYEPQYVEISINGVVSRLELSDETILVGEQNLKNPFSVQGNELLQTTNYFTVGEPFKSFDFNIPYDDTSYYNKDFESIGNVDESYERVEDYLGNVEHVYHFVLKNFKETMGLSNASKIYYNNYCEISYNGTIYEGDVRINSIGDLEIYVSTESRDDYFLSNIKYFIWNISADFPVQINNSINQMYEETIQEYQDGKETATLSCSIGDYYETNGDLAISDKSPQKMCFDVNDIVIPMVLGSDGKDIPMSKTNDSNPKEFMVLSAKPIYDGAVWQQLILQEV